MKLFRNYSSGFTLVEMLIVVTIIGILSAIALPSYQTYIEKTDLTDAKQSLVSLRQALEAEKLLKPISFATQKGYTDFLDTGTTGLNSNNRRKYNFATNVPAATNGSIYKIYLSASPIRNSYRYGIWIDNDGIAYRCNKSDVGNNTPSSKPASCEVL